jgi:DNA-binding NarL/FixJ family response regulator
VDVLLLLAQGLSVRECAERLGLACPTVDNHKSRLMRRLEVHKVTDLLRIAFREGLVVP